MRKISLVKQEDGIYIPLVAGILVALLFVVGIGAEAGYLYLTKLRLHRALDGAVTSAAYYYHEQLVAASAGAMGGIRDATADQVKIHLKASFTKMSSVAFDPENFNQITRVPCPDESTPSDPSHGSGGPLNYAGLTVSVCDDGIWAKANVSVAPVLLSALPWNIAATTVSEEAKASQYVLTVAMVLDVSGSMDNDSNPAKHGSSECNHSDSSSEFYLLNCLSKITALKYAAKLFVSGLVAGDRLAIVNFQKTGAVKVSMKTVAYNPAGQVVDTAYCNSIADSSSWPRGCFNFEIDELTADSNTNIYDGVRLGGLEIANAPAPPPDRRTMNFMVLVSDGSPIDAYTQKQWKGTPLGYYSEAVSKTLYTEFYNWSSVDNNGNSNISKPNNEWGTEDNETDKKRMYHSAINIADDLRNKYRATIFSVGFGKELIPTSSDPQKAYQDVNESDLKPVLLHRIANENPKMTPPWPEFPSVVNPNPSKTPGSRKYEQVADLPEGKYYHAETGDDLTKAFASIGMLMRTYLTK